MGSYVCFSLVTSNWEVGITGLDMLLAVPAFYYLSSPLFVAEVFYLSEYTMEGTLQTGDSTSDKKRKS